MTALAIPSRILHPFHRVFLLTGALWCFLPLSTAEARAQDANATPAEVLQASGVTGGLIIHVNAEDPEWTAGLRPSERFRVQGLVKDAAPLREFRETLRGLGKYGPVALDSFDGEKLPFIDNTANLVVARELGGVDIEEIHRVLAPEGTAMVFRPGQGWIQSVKKRSESLDEWTHYFYDAKGNAVSHDDVVAPPEKLQWLGGPRWSRHHDRMSSLSAMVSAGGKLFYIIDEGSRVSILLPSKWKLIARDAFNGITLWKRPIEEWHSQMWPLKSGPTQLTRRLVALDGRVYVTLGLHAPVACLDADTGETLTEYDSTRGAEEILVEDGLLYALVNPQNWALTDFAPEFNTGDQKRVETEFNWDEKPRELQVIDLKTGELLWKRTDKIAPITLASDGKRLVYYDGACMVCLDPSSGEEHWKSEPVAKRRLFEYNYTPRLLLHDDLVLYAGGDGAMKALDADSGKELWNAPHQKSGYRSPEDLMVAGGLVWNAPTLSGNMTGAFTGRNPLTGEVVKQFPPDVDTYWFHHRCYIAKATDRFLIPSRTGIEFVDFNNEHWDINHWVRSACLYGVLPCNGLVYAAPHNCACYPEAKLFGFNALAPATTSLHPDPLPAEERLIKGAAYDRVVQSIEADAKDWPTYRHDPARSGYSNQPLADDLTQAWATKLGGELSALVVAAGKLFVSQIEQHAVHALDSDTGQPLWHYIAGGRVDSPPTYWKGRVLFGCADGWVYCLDAANGNLVWKFQAAPSDRRQVVFEQVESVWPVPGSVLVEDGKVSFVAGRSVFLDGGMRFYRLDAATGKPLVETILDDRDPETGGDLQDRIQTLQMPVGLNDVLSSDGEFTYLRSQKFDPEGKRVDIGPVSGNAAQQGGAQQGPGAHIFAPMGFLDDSWFHRSYWVYGKNFAGGHNGYHQAGKYAPAGRLLVFDDENVFGYGREAKYYKWTTTMEHQLFSASREIPEASPNADSGPFDPHPHVRFPDTGRINPEGKSLTVEAWVLPDQGDGVIIAYGGGVQGYSLALADKKPGFYIRRDSQLTAARSNQALTPGWHHLAGVFDQEHQIQIYVDGVLAAETPAGGAPMKKPAQGMALGTDGSSAVGDYGSNLVYTGLIDELAVYPRALAAEEIERLASPVAESNAVENAALYCSFDRGDARDESGGGTHGVLARVDSGKGKRGAALWFRPEAKTDVLASNNKPNKPKGYHVDHHWQGFIPMFTRAMAKAGDTLLVSGPPDLVDEEKAFELLTQRDSAIQKELAKQDDALEGKLGASLTAISTVDGKPLREIKMEKPPVWDGMTVAQGRLYVALTDGRVVCFGRPQVARLLDMKQDDVQVATQ